MLDYNSSFLGRSLFTVYAYRRATFIELALFLHLFRKNSIKDVETEKI